MRLALLGPEIWFPVEYGYKKTANGILETQRLRPNFSKSKEICSDQPEYCEN